MIRSAVDVHARSLATSTNLSSLYVANFIKPEDVIRVLNRAEIKFVLAGAHGLGGWIGAPRATQDTDVIVATRYVRKAVQALVSRFRHLEARDEHVVVRLRDRDGGSVAVDIINTIQPIFKAALQNTFPIRIGRQNVFIPSLEMALALKFAPMTSPNRVEKKKYLDAHDFIGIVQENANIDLTKLHSLGNLVYPGGGKEILEMVRRVRAGERLRL